MGETSKIEWTDATWNPWQGCTKVSPACQNCYMFADLKRYGRDGSIVVRSKPPTFNLPLKRRRDGEYAIPPGSKVFTCSWSDWFHQVADPWRAEAWEIIRQRPDVTFQIVTKRTERIAECLPADWGDGYPNVWLIATAENQEWLDKRVPELLRIPAVVHGLSIEPLLWSIDIGLSQATCVCCERWPSRWIELPRPVRGDFPIGHTTAADAGVYRASSNRHGALSVTARNGRMLGIRPSEFRSLGSIDWVIVGGESGSGARPMRAEWVQSIRDQCRVAGVPFFFKQWGDWLPALQDGAPDVEAPEINASDEPIRVGKKRAGRMLDRRTWSEFPAVPAVA